MIQNRYLCTTVEEDRVARQIAEIDEEILVRLLQLSPLTTTVIVFVFWLGAKVSVPKVAGWG